LNDDSEEGEALTIPQDCFKANTDVNNSADLTLLLSTLRFWGVSTIPKTIITYTVWHKPIEVIDAFVEFEQELPYVKFLRALCERVEGSCGVAVDSKSAWVKFLDAHFGLNCLDLAALLCVYQYEHHDGEVWNAQTCQLAATACGLNLLRFLHEHGCPWDESCCEEAARADCLQCLRYAHEHGCPWDSNTCTVAARSYNVDCLQYAHEHGCPWDSFAYETARYGGVCYKYLTENGCPEGEGLMNAAAMAGKVLHAQALHEKGCAWSERTSDAAAVGGQQQTLKYLYEHGCPLSDDVGSLAAEVQSLTCLQYLLEVGGICGDNALNVAARNRNNPMPFRFLLDAGCGRERACLFAATYGNIDALRYALDKGCPLPPYAPNIAAFSSSLACLRYAHEMGCPWDRGICASILWSFKEMQFLTRSKEEESANKFACLRYAHEHGCPWDEETCQAAAKFGELACLQYAHEHGCPWDVSAVEDAMDAGSLSCLKYLHEHGCAWPAEWFRSVARTARNRKCLEYALEHPEQRPVVPLTLPVDCAGCGCAKTARV
jgi:hypothetical protein